MRILIAEDNETNRLVINALLAGDGHDLSFAGNGVEAVESASVDHFDLILMDMRMPDMDGLEATRAIRAMDNSNAKTPIVALTGDVLPEHRQEALEAGMTDFLTKPVDADRLRSVVETAALDGHDTAQTL